MTTPEPREFSPEDPVVPAAQGETVGPAGPAGPTGTGPSGPYLPGSSMPPLMPQVPERKSRKPLLFGLGGLGVGLVVGLLLGGLFSTSGTTEEDGGGESSSAAALSLPIVETIETCGLTGNSYASVMDGGTSLEISTEGKESAGVAISDIACVVQGLAMPQSVIARLDSTRALDGTQSADWSGFTATWTYHPDSGLNIIVETTGK